MCSACKSEPVSPVAQKQGHNLCWVCNGSRARVEKEAKEMHAWMEGN